MCTVPPLLAAFQQQGGGGGQPAPGTLKVAHSKIMSICQGLRCTFKHFCPPLPTFDLFWPLSGSFWPLLAASICSLVTLPTIGHLQANFNTFGHLWPPSGYILLLLSTSLNVWPLFAASPFCRLWTIFLFLLPFLPLLLTGFVFYCRLWAVSLLPWTALGHFFWLFDCFCPF